MTVISAIAPRGRTGDVDATSGLEAFCRAVRPRLLGFLTVQHGHEVAEELAQETLARVYLSWDRVRGLERPQAWAYHVAINLSRSLVRRKLAELRALARAGGDPEAAEAIETADVLAVRQAVARLARSQRLVVLLRYFAGLSVAETAEALGLSQGTVKSTTHDAIRVLRTRGGLADGGWERRGA